MDNCGRLVSGEPCMRLPGHGGVCLPGHIQPVSTTPNPGIPTSLFDAIAAEYVKSRWWRIAWRVFNNRDTIRFALLSMIVIAQIWIDIYVIMLGR